MVAEGDRAALLEISEYISQQVRRRLTVVHSGSPQTDLALTAKQLSTPTSLQYTEPLGYLALCDLNSVLQQCEQQSAILPVELPTVSASDIVNKPTVVAVNSPSNASSNVIPISMARRRVRRGPAVWASSAAAALLAVGLTTSLWTRTQSGSERSPELSATADADATLAERPPESDELGPR